MRYRFAGSEERLKRVFEGGFAARDIASALASFGSDLPAVSTRTLMEEQGFHVAGVRRRGQIEGYVEVYDLVGGTVGEHCRSFASARVVHDMATFSEVLEGLESSERVFVEVFGEVGGLITRSDVEKPPMRMWLFGFVTLLEMRMTRFIEAKFPDDAWIPLISKPRLELAEVVREERRRRGQQVRLLDCLQLGDIATIVLSGEETREDLELPSRRSGRKLFKSLESLRNNLAHSNEIVAHDWMAVVGIARELDSTLTLLNKLGKTKKAPAVPCAAQL